MKKTNKIILYFLIAMCFFILPSTNTEASKNKKDFEGRYESKIVKYARIKKGSYESVDVLKENICNLNVAFIDGFANISFELSGNLLEYRLSLYKGNIAYGAENNSVIGISDLTLGSYEIVCFRIEKSADSITLMNANQDLVGKTVLFLGISEKDSDEIIYIQEELADVDFEDILEMADRNTKSGMYSDDYIKNIELQYVFGIDKSESISTTSLINDEINERNNDIQASNGDNSTNLLKILKNGNYVYGAKNYYENVSLNQNNIETYSVLPPLNDSIFKTITSNNKWTHVKDNYQPYSYWQYGYLGTNNPATIIVVFNWIHNYNITNGLYNSLSIAYNETVIYNVTTGALGCGIVEKNPVTVTNAMIKSALTQSSSKNCFLSFTQEETSNSTNLNLSSGVSLLLRIFGGNKTAKVLSTWSAIKNLATSYNSSTIYFYGNPKLQNKYYESVVSELTVTAKNNLKNSGDCINFAGATYITPEYTSEYSYTVSK